MAEVEKIPIEALRSVAAQISERLPVADRALSSRRLAVLAESLPIYVLDSPPVAARDISACALRTSYWHHQIRQSAESVGFARSRETQGDWTVMEVVGSGFGASLDRAIGLVDERAPGEDWEARLLMAPAFYLTAIWLHSLIEDLVLVVSSPPTLTNLETGVLYPAERFLTLLWENPPSRGVPLPDEE